MKKYFFGLKTIIYFILAITIFFIGSSLAPLQLANLQGAVVSYEFFWGHILHMRGLFFTSGPYKITCCAFRHHTMTHFFFGHTTCIFSFCTATFLQPHKVHYTFFSFLLILCNVSVRKVTSMQWHGNNTMAKRGRHCEKPKC